ncbi:MAG: DUF4340 domain-containing protein [Rhodospirillales bacterium]|nr:DUF4340 domain-containing protein [Rhodospirillales bacterium]
MTPRFIAGLATLTAVAVVAAAVGVWSRYGAAAPATPTEPVFADLGTRLNQTTEISVTTRAGTIVMKAGANGWVVANRGNFPARTDKVIKAAVQLSQLRFADAKTSLPDRYDRLEVEDIATKDSKSKLLRLADAQGATLAKIIVGRQVDSYRPGREAVYVRRPGDAQAWLAAGGLDVSGEMRDWVAREVIDIQMNRVSRATTVAPNGTALVVARAKPEDKFVVDNLPDGAKLKESAAGGIEDVARSLAYLDLSDVRPVAEFDFANDKATKIEVRTFDGLIVQVRVIDHEGGSWARFEASANPALASGPMAGAVDAQKEADALNARLGPWAYKLQDYKTTAFRMRLSDLLEAKS